MKTENSYPYLRTALIAVAIAAVASAITTTVLVRRTSSAQSAGQSDLQSITKSRVLRAGYVSNPPSSIIDPNTHKVTGIFAEAIEAIAAKANLKVEWTEEVGFGSMIEGLNANRYDIVPCALWPTTERAVHATFSRPLFYSGVCAYVRADDHRFDANLSLINSPKVKIATIDGEMAAAIATTDFPQAATLALPQMSEIATMLLNVKDGKADITFVEIYFAEEFLKNNPRSIRNITPNHPVRVFPNTILMRSGQPELQTFLNTALEEITNLGIVNRLLNKYEPVPGTFYRLAEPFAQWPEQTAVNPQ